MSRPAITYTKLFINNEWRDAVAGGTFETVRDPRHRPAAARASYLTSPFPPLSLGSSTRRREK